jgi:MFS family permease
LIAERFGERNLLALGTAILGLAFLGLGFAPGFWAILSRSFSRGLGSSVQHPLGSTIISRAYAAEGGAPRSAPTTSPATSASSRLARSSRC